MALYLLLGHFLVWSPVSFVLKFDRQDLISELFIPKLFKEVLNVWQAPQEGVIGSRQHVILTSLTLYHQTVKIVGIYLMNRKKTELLQ